MSGNGDPCICGATIWHPECYGSFAEFFAPENRELTRANIREWKAAHDFIADPVFRAVRKGIPVPEPVK